MKQRSSSKGNSPEGQAIHQSNPMAGGGITAESYSAGIADKRRISTAPDAATTCHPLLLCWCCCNSAAASRSAVPPPSSSPVRGTSVERIGERGAIPTWSDLLDRRPPPDASAQRDARGRKKHSGAASAQEAASAAAGPAGELVCAAANGAGGERSRCTGRGELHPKRPGSFALDPTGAE